MARFASIVEKMFDPKGYKPEDAPKKKNPWQNVRLKNKNASVKESAESSKYACPKCKSTDILSGPKDQPNIKWRGSGQCGDCGFKGSLVGGSFGPRVSESDDTGMQGFLDKAKKPEKIKKIQNHIDHVKDLLKKAPAEDKVKLSATLAGLKADLKKAQVSESTVSEWTSDDDVPIRAAHAHISKRIEGMKKEGKDVSKLEDTRDSLDRLLKAGDILSKMQKGSSKVSESVEDADVHLQSAHDALASAITKAKRQGKDVSKLEKIKSSLASHLKEITKE